MGLHRSKTRVLFPTVQLAILPGKSAGTSAPDAGHQLRKGWLTGYRDRGEVHIDIKRAMHLGAAIECGTLAKVDSAARSKQTTEMHDMYLDVYVSMY